MAYERRTISGGVPATTVAAGIDGSTLTITITDATSWPTGTVGDFGVVIDRGEDTEEKCLIDSRTTTTLTVASGGRGVDGTSASAHLAGAVIEHCLLARDLDEANAHLADTSLDHHTQYLNTTRHDLEARHQFGAALGTPSAAAAIGTSASAGTGDDPAREDHVHVIGTGAINSAGMFAAGVVDSAAIATDAVGSAEIAADAVGATEIAAGAVGAGELATDAVTAAKILAGAVETAKLADDAVTAAKLADGAVDATPKLSDAIITMAKIASEAGTDYVPTLTGVTLGSGGTKYGRYFKFGRLVAGVAGFTLGTSANVTATIQVSLPVACGTTGADWIFAARGYDSSGALGASGMGVILDGESVGKNIVTVGTSFWDATAPFNWDDGDSFRAIFLYEAAT